MINIPSTCGKHHAKSRSRKKALLLGRSFMSELASCDSFDDVNKNIAHARKPVPHTNALWYKMVDTVEVILHKWFRSDPSYQLLCPLDSHTLPENLQTMHENNSYKLTK